MLKLRFGVQILFLALAITGYLSAQDGKMKSPQSDTNTDTGIWHEEWMNKINLSEDQLLQVDDLLFSYQTEFSAFHDTPETMGNSKSELRDRYFSEIEGLLNADQKTLWQSFRNNWWANLSSGLNKYNPRYNRDNAMLDYQYRDRGEDF